MNAAFHRGEAFSKLENYSTVIVEHLALITWFFDHGAVKKELTTSNWMIL